MGDSVLTEILARHQRGALPEYFNTFFQTVTFTNGGMVYDLINKRLSQVLGTLMPTLSFLESIILDSIEFMDGPGVQFNLM